MSPKPSTTRTPSGTEEIHHTHRTPRCETAHPKELPRTTAAPNDPPDIYGINLDSQILGRQFSKQRIAHAEAEDFETIVYPSKRETPKRAPKVAIGLCIVAILAITSAAFVALSVTSTRATAAQIEAWQLCR